MPSGHLIFAIYVQFHIVTEPKFSEILKKFSKAWIFPILEAAALNRTLYADGGLAENTQLKLMVEFHLAQCEYMNSKALFLVSLPTIFLDIPPYILTM